MSDSHRRPRLVATALAGMAAALVVLGAGAADAVPGTASLTSSRSARHRDGFGRTVTPIKHVIVIIGENHTFDNVFATYRAPRHQHVLNLLSEKIVTASGAPGRAAGKARQRTASDTTAYQVSPPKTGSYGTLPQPNTTYVSPGCDGQPENQPDTRFPANLQNAPYQITKYVPYFDDHGAYGDKCTFDGAFVGDPIHRFYQM
jgi:phospholipase C